jgi:hypothetical protein
MRKAFPKFSAKAKPAPPSAPVRPGVVGAKACANPVELTVGLAPAAAGRSLRCTALHALHALDEAPPAAELGATAKETRVAEGWRGHFPPALL